MMSTIIQEVSTTDLKPHPENVSIYGDEVMLLDFLESIKTLGVIEPLLIRRDGTIISGHRRWVAAKKAGLDTVPARTIDLNDELEEMELLISSNKQRAKTLSQIAREGKELQRIEAERAKRRMETGKKIDPETNLSKGATDEHVAAELGMSMTQWKKLKTVFDRAKSGDEEAQELLKALDAGDISVHKAYQKVTKTANEKQREVDAKQKEIDELKANPVEVKVTEETKVYEAPPEVAQEMEDLKSDLETLKGEKVALEEGKKRLEDEIKKARATKQDYESLEVKRAEAQTALNALIKKKDEKETVLQYITEMSLAVTAIRRLLEEKKGSLERLAKTGIPSVWDAKEISITRDLCYDIAELLTKSIDTVCLFGGLKEVEE